MRYINTRVVFRLLALCVALVGAVGVGKLQGGLNLFLWLGAVFSLLAFGEFESKDLTQRLKIKTMTSLRLQSTWLGKLFELCSFFAYSIYIGAQIFSK